MSPSEVKSKIQGAYIAALRSNTYYSGGSSFDYTLRDIHIFGREAGADFVKTFSGQIVQEAMELAKRRQVSMQINLNKSGLDALEGAAQALRDLTGLPVEASQSAITITWADDSRQLI